jgi:hypothetical protein
MQGIVAMPRIQQCANDAGATSFVCQLASDLERDHLAETFVRNAGSDVLLERRTKIYEYPYD